jgi:AmmeMemoRadiSam system protein B/AmmeMemoRadiSam system protein A
MNRTKFMKRIAFLAFLAMVMLVAACAGPTATPVPTETPEPTVALTPTAVSEATPTPAEVRKPAVAGQFYPDDAEQLSTMVDAFLDQAEELGAERPEPIAIIVPHAGYIFSGQVAACAFKQIEGVDYEAIVVVGTNHYASGFHQISVYAEGAFETPLGLVPVDKELAKALIAADERIVFDRGVHRDEHSIEVELPFLQRLYPGHAIVPVIVGEPSPENCEALSEALAQALSGKKALIIASSDLSHYPTYDDACRVDLATLEAIETMDPQRLTEVISKYMNEGIPELYTLCCGEGPIRVAMLVAKKLGANQATVLKYANSGDTPFGDRDRVVGYGAVMLWRGEKNLTSPSTTLRTGFVTSAPPSPPQEPVPLNSDEGEKLLVIARQTIAQFLETVTIPHFEVSEPNLYQERGCFVTLKKHGELRGCIGHLVPRMPLYLTVQNVAISAAISDSRFPPVTREELKDISVEISILSPFELIEDVSEIEVGRHGLVIVKEQNQGVLLPQVATEQNWDLDEFLRQICLKADLPEDAWQEGAQLYVFTAEVFGEEH